jgi:hypothetical protein
MSSNEESREGPGSDVTQVLSEIAVACFVFNRPDHTERMLTSLAANEESADLPVYVFCDGPRSESEEVATSSVRQVVSKFSSKLNIIQRFEPSNRGVSEQIISGIDTILKKHEMVIVIEEDLVLSPYFLRYMIDGLKLYREEQRVISIHGYLYPNSEKLPETFFLRGADCWGWATWKRGWDLFSGDAEQLFRDLRRQKLVRKFNYGYGSMFTDMLLAHSKGTLSGWDVCWHASAVLNGKLTLYPSKSLVFNAGHDGSGTHSITTGLFDTDVANGSIMVGRIEVRESRAGLRVVRSHLAKFSQNNFERTLRGFKKSAGKRMQSYLRGKSLRRGLASLFRIGH